MKPACRADTLSRVSPSIITPAVLSSRMESPNPPIVLDVREAAELEIARLPEALHMPLSELEESISGLDPYGEYVVVCHHGIRSAQAANCLIDRGVTRVFNLLGGIDAWAAEVDPSMPRY